MAATTTLRPAEAADVRSTSVFLAHYGAGVREALKLRDEAIRDAHTAGMTLRAIAEAVGLSHTGVKHIIDRR